VTDKATDRRAAFYSASPGSAWRDWWTVLHPPYTAWHLAYVVIGAALAPAPRITPLVGSLIAFFLAVGVAAHCLDELNGRPLRTEIRSSVLLGTAAVSLAGAVALGVIGISRTGVVLVPFIAVGAGLVIVYNLELAGGALHNDTIFGLAWGAFPVVTAYVAEAHTLGWSAVVAAGAAFGLSLGQRFLSTRARMMRRSVREVAGVVTMMDGREIAIDDQWVLEPIEQALKCCSWAVVAFAAALAIDKFR
jgi:hypothetical protein